MNEALYITNSILIAATPGRVWEVLTQAEETQKYMFGCRTVSDWQPGSSLLWVGTWEGKDIVFVKGTIQEIEPGQKLVYSVFDPNSQSLEDIPENYLWVTYELQKAEGGTLLSVRQGDFSKVAEGERRYQESYQGGEGWNPILVQIKAQAESL